MLSVSHIYVVDQIAVNEEICSVIMTAYLKIAIFFSTLLLQLPSDQRYARIVPTIDARTIQDMFPETTEQVLSPSVVSGALADY